MTPISNSLHIETKAIRFFYCLVLQHSLPTNLTDKESKQACFDSLEFELQTLLEPQGFQVAFDEKAGIKISEQQEKTCLVSFLVSKVCEFKFDDIVIPNPSYTSFKVTAASMSSVRNTLTQNIRDALFSKMITHELAFIMTTSRNFDFEVFYEGVFRVKREFSDDEIVSEGGVNNALESFFEEVESAIQPFGFEVDSASSRQRRSRNNEYLFDVFYAPIIGFNESTVHGEGCYAVRGDASRDEINTYGIDFENTFENEINAQLYSILEEHLPLDVDLISSKISYIDDPGEVFAISDDLIPLVKDNQDVEMLKRQSRELQFVKPKAPMPTVEIDIDSIPEGLHGYGDLLTQALASVAQESIKLTATIYVYQCMSSNFGNPSWSAFFGVAGDKKLLKILFNAFQDAKVAQVRMSDYIESSMAINEFHIQDGYIWRPLEEGTWYAKMEDIPEPESSVVIEIEESECSIKNLSRSAIPTRFRAARADTTVGTIRQKIEEVFGLPEGSVAICGPDKRPLRKDATIATVRRRWE